jgi:hypothetical protein
MARWHTVCDSGCSATHRARSSGARLRRATHAWRIAMASGWLDSNPACMPNRTNYILLVSAMSGAAHPMRPKHRLPSEPNWLANVNRRKHVILRRPVTQRGTQSAIPWATIWGG